MNFDFLQAFAVIMIIFALGDIISGATKGKIPSIFVISVLILVGFWVGLPKDIISISKMDAIGEMAMALVLIHMGTLLDIEEIKREWRTVLTIIGSILGIVVILGIVIIPLFGLETFAVVVPPLTGGGMAAIIMSTAAQAKGLVQLAILAIMMLLTQSFIAAPITANALRKEGENLKAEFNKAKANGELKTDNNKEKDKKARPFDRIPDNYKTPAFYLAIVAILAVLNNYAIVPYTGAFLDKTITALILGIFVGEVGLVDRAPLQKAQSFGILMIGLISIIMGFLNQATPEILLSLIKPISVSLVFAVIGVYIFSTFIGKKLGYSKSMAFAIGLNCFLGFPFNYSLTDEACRVVADTDEEHTFLMSKILPNMLIAGFVSVTLVSVIIAGVFTKLI